MKDDKPAQPHPSGLAVLTPRGVQQWAGDSAGSASRAPGAFRSVLGDVGDDHVRMFQEFQERERAPQASPADHGEEHLEEGSQGESPQRVTYRIPSTFNLGQALLWISTSISGHLSRAQLEREMERWRNYNPKAEPPIALVVGRLRDAHLDPLSADQHPTISAEAVFEEAGIQLLDALRGGKVTMRGKPSDPQNSAEALSPYQCEQIYFSEGQYGAARAVIANRPERFWGCLRFTPSELMELWPVTDAQEAGVTEPAVVEAPAPAVEPAPAAVEASSPKGEAAPAVVEPKKRGRPKGTGKQILDQPHVDAALVLLRDKKFSSPTAAVEHVLSKSIKKSGEAAEVTRIRRRVRELWETEKKGE